MMEHFLILDVFCNNKDQVTLSMVTPIYGKVNRTLFSSHKIFVIGRLLVNILACYQHMCYNLTWNKTLEIPLIFLIYKV